MELQGLLEFWSVVTAMAGIAGNVRLVVWEVRDVTFGHQPIQGLCQRIEQRLAWLLALP